MLSRSFSTKLFGRLRPSFSLASTSNYLFNKISFLSILRSFLFFLLSIYVSKNFALSSLIFFIFSISFFSSIS